MTQREFFNAIVTGIATVKDGKTKDAEVRNFNLVTIDEEGNAVIAKEIIDFALDEIKKLDKKNDKKKTSLTEAQKENLKFADEIFDWMSVGAEVTSKDVSVAFGISTQKATALLKKLVEADKVTSSTVKIDGRAVKAYTAIKEDTQTEDTEAESGE